MKSRMVWASHLKSIKKRDHSKDLGIDVRIILKRILRHGMAMRTTFTWLRMRSGIGIFLTQ
jgi:hypothetical protein